MDNPQKKLISILINVAVFAGVAAVVFLVLNYSVVKKEDVVFRCIPSEISEISITAGSDRLFLRENEGVWYVDSESIPQKHIDILRNLYCHIPYVDRFKVNGDDLSLYGISEGSSRVEFKLKKTDAGFLIGSETPSGTEFYIAVPSEKSIYTASNKIRSALIPTKLDMGLRNAFKLNNAHQIEVKNYEGGEQRFIKQGDKWPDEAEKIAGLMRAAYFENYFGPMTVEDAQQYGFYFPDHIIRISGETGEADEYQMTFFNGRYYVLVEKHGEKGSYYVLVLNSSSGKKLSDALKEIIKDGGLRGGG